MLDGSESLEVRVDLQTVFLHDVFGAFGGLHLEEEAVVDHQVDEAKAGGADVKNFDTLFHFALDLVLSEPGRLPDEFLVHLFFAAFTELIEGFACEVQDHAEEGVLDGVMLEVRLERWPPRVSRRDHDPAAQHVSEPLLLQFDPRVVLGFEDEPDLRRRGVQLG